VLLLVAGYAASVRHAKRSGAPEDAHPWAFAAGTVAFWLAADWPVGPLGTGYLASVHTVQYIAFSMLVPPLLLYGLPTAPFRSLARGSYVAPLVRLLTRPLMAFVIFNAVLVITHLPTVVDGFKVTQVGAFAVDMAWLAAGVLFWWQVLGRVAELDPLPLPGRIVFVLLNVFIPTVPAAFLTFADYPIYAVYELAPRMSELSAAEDQQLAGLIMKTVGGLTLFGTASVLFFRWYAKEEGEIL
jgi:putative membrane protein